MQIALILDVIIAMLLVLTIAYAVRLNYRLSQLRSDKNELLVLAKTFAEATMRAESGIKTLQVSTDTLTREIKKAEVLKDDLAYLVDRGGRTADEMVDEAIINPNLKVKSPSRQKPSGYSGAKQPKPLRSARPQSEANETRLIEDAIRAATMEENEVTPAARETRQENTRRIRGHLGGVDAADKLPSSDYGEDPFGELANDQGNGDDETIKNTQAARDLLEALGGAKR